MDRNALYINLNVVDIELNALQRNAYVTYCIVLNSFTMV